MMGTAVEKVITPVDARACRIPTDAEELCMMAVSTMPIRIPAKGFEKRIIIASNSGLF